EVARLTVGGGMQVDSNDTVEINAEVLQSIITTMEMLTKKLDALQLAVDKSSQAGPVALLTDLGDDDVKPFDMDSVDEKPVKRRQRGSKSRVEKLFLVGAHLPITDIDLTASSNMSEHMPIKLSV
ncbi:15463_t:CDS:1, partial [Acaulospora colombiana]